MKPRANPAELPASRTLARSAYLVAILFGFIALVYMTLANFAAVNMASPLILTLLAIGVLVLLRALRFVIAKRGCDDLRILQQVRAGGDGVAGARRATLPGTDIDTAAQAQDRRNPQVLVDLDRRGDASAPDSRLFDPTV